MARAKKTVSSVIAIIRWYALSVSILLGIPLLLSACADRASNTISLPLAEDRPTFMFFYTDN
jgi:hypothetical protein